MNKKLKIRLVATAAVIALAVACIPASNRYLVKAESASALRAQKEELEEKIASLENKKSLLNDDLDNKKQRRAYIQEQIELKEQELSVNDELISALQEELSANEAAITSREEEIKQREIDIQDRFAALQQRLRIVAKTGNMSTLQMLFDTDDYVDYLLKSKVIECISENDQRMISEMEEEIAAINGEKKVLEDDRATLNSRMKDLTDVQAAAEADRLELEALYSEAQGVIVDLQDDIDYVDEQIAYTEEQAAALEAEIQDILARAAQSEHANTQIYEGGTMYWPSSSCFLVTDTFGWRTLDGASNFHGGIDIACPGSAYGCDIVAAEDGTVIYVNSYDSWGSGWGYYVIVDHGIDAYGNHITTLYAHCSSIYVSEGQTVTGGQTCLGAIGNTGWSYGSHLHFEVRVDGERVNPLAGYVAAP